MTSLAFNDEKVVDNSMLRFKSTTSIAAIICSVLLVSSTILSRQFTPELEYSAFWPIAGITFSAAFIWGLRILLVLLLVTYAMAFAHFSSYFSFPIFLTLLSTLVPSLAGLLLRRRHFLDKINLNTLTLKNVLSLYIGLLFLVSLPSAFLSSSLVYSNALFPDATHSQLLAIYWLSETAGLLMFFPLVMLFVKEYNQRKHQLFDVWLGDLCLGSILLTSFYLGLQADGLYKQISIFICLPLIGYYAVTQRSAFKVHFMAVAWIIMSLYVAKDIPLPVESNIEVLFLSGFMLLLIGCLITIHTIWLSVNRQRQLTAQIEKRSLIDSSCGLLNEKGTLKALNKLTLPTLRVYAFSLRKHRDLLDSLGSLTFFQIATEFAERIQQQLSSVQCVSLINGSTIIAICTQHDDDEYDFNTLARITEVNFLEDQSVDLKDISSSIVTFNQSNKYELIEIVNTSLYLASKSPLHKRYVGNANDEQLKEPIEQFKEFQNMKKWLDLGYLKMWGQSISPLNNQNLPHKTELLARICLPDGHVVYPNSFMPLIEQFGFESEFDKYVLKESFKIASLQGQEHHRFSINVSANSFSQLDFPSLVEKLLNEFNGTPHHICLEITESNSIPNLDVTINNVLELQRRGIEIGLDDFGTGFANFEYLMEIPFNFVKLDGRFIKNITDDPQSLSAVKALVAIATSSNMKTVAEYVESEQLAILLATHHIDYGQGYGIGKPKPVMP